MSAALTPTTRERYRAQPGEQADVFGYGPARSALHEQLLDNIFEGVPTGVAHPFYIALWGGANSAKSVVLRVLLNRGCLGEQPAIFGMEAFATIPEFAALAHTAPHPEKEPPLRDEYYDLMMKALMRAQKLGCNIVIDDHGDEVKQYRRHLDYLAAQEKAHPKMPHRQTLLLGQSIDPTFFMWWMERRPNLGEYNPTRADNHAFTHKAIAQFKSLIPTWELLAPLYDIAVLNETTIGMKQKIQRITAHEKQPDGTSRCLFFDRQRFDQSVRVWQLVDPHAHSTDTLWPQAGIDAAADIRRRVAYRPESDPEAQLMHHARETPSTLIHSPAQPLRERLNAELDHRRAAS